jgi:hypothetical protein
MSPQDLYSLGYSHQEVLLVGRLLSDANTSVNCLKGITRNSTQGRRLVAHAHKHVEQQRMAREYGYVS